MLQAIVEKGITTENVAAMESLVGLYERMEAKNAEKEFNAAFAKMQATMPNIAATKAVPDKQGNLKYRYAPYEEILEKVQPLLTAHGFSVSFDMEFKEGRVISTCILRHSGGHSQRNSFAVRIGGGPPGASETQADGAAKTYARRGALADALNIVVSHDDDARVEGSGETISSEKAEEIRRRVRDNDAIDEVRFLKWCKVSDFEEIPASKLDKIEVELTRKEREMGQ